MVRVDCARERWGNGLLLQNEFGAERDGENGGYCKCVLVELGPDVNGTVAGDIQGIVHTGRFGSLL